MIIKENGLRYAKLIHVSVDNGMTSNSNKVYIMEELSDGRIKCEYGRVGKSLVTEYKPSSKWDSVLKQKLSKTSKGATKKSNVGEGNYLKYLVKTMGSPLNVRDGASVSSILRSNASANRV